eukprot:TRINITY_DN12492_c0_g1_i1.p1 TRINITY_DN12492_c0_g1~~TRINITY_DN12492_c0_g1_i1.p1  ORF type:complete len:176 (+),score=20.98 TRINITY_DN12492_c0_g1_i1:65-592(+)
MQEPHADHAEHSAHCNCHKATVGVESLDEVKFARSIVGAAANSDWPKVKSMLASGISATTQDRDGYTALHYVARYNQPELCKALISSGCDVNATTRLGKATPLHRAAITGQTDVIRVLLRRGANPMLQDDDGQTAAHKAAMGKHRDCLQLLLSAAPEIEQIPDKRGRVPNDWSVV